jgi:hypothetical protein
METLSSAELLELIATQSALLDSQFQYWLSVSFAVIVASFAAHEQLKAKARVWIGVLYSGISAVFLIRYFSSFELIRVLANEAVARELQTGGTPVAGYVRGIVWLGGLVTTLWFLLRPSAWRSKNDG